MKTLILLFASALCACAQVGFLNVSQAFIGSGSQAAMGGGGSGGCGLCASNTAAPSDQCYLYTNGDKVQQQITNEWGSIVVCKLQAYLNTVSGSTTLRASVWDTIGGNQIGGYSANVVASTEGTVTFEWTSNKPNPTGDFVVEIERVSSVDGIGFTVTLDYYVGGGAPYEVFKNGSSIGGGDLWFLLYREE